jgi:hypothetical protein
MNGAELLKPVFEFLDMLIAEHGDIFYMVLVYISLPVLVWILSGGLRRRFSRRRSIAAPPIIVIWRTSTPPPLPPSDPGDYRPPLDDDDQWFDA